MKRCFKLIGWMALKVSVYKDATFETIKALHFINQSKLNYLFGSLDEMLKLSTDEEEILTVEYLTSQMKTLFEMKKNCLFNLK